MKTHNLHKHRGPSFRRGPFYIEKGSKMSKKKHKQPEHFALKNIQPLTKTQEETFSAYYSDKNLILHGYPGTGKTYISLYLALKDVLEPDPDYEKIMILRSVVPSRDIGFLPGSIREKARIYEEPYKEICDELFGRGDGYDILKMRKLVEFGTTSFLRGLTFKNMVVIVDEIQNMTFQELDTIMTRIGDNSKIIFSGDFRQTDLNERDRSGLLDFINITKGMNSFDYIEFGAQDIVRSDIVKNYIMTKTSYLDGKR